MSEINFLNADAEYITSNLISDFQEYTKETLYPADERRIMLQGLGYVLAVFMNHINETGKSNLVRFAKGNELDEIAKIYHATRLEPSYATTVIKFTLSTTPKNDVIIEKGTRVTADGNIFFATDEDILFSASNSETVKEVSATATVTGSEANGFAIGQINNLVDGNIYVASVTNTTESTGGSDIESDEDFRERLMTSPFSLSVAGPKNAYKAIAMSSSNDIQDVSVYRPSAGCVEIAVLKKGGVIPSAEDDCISKIYNACNDVNARPPTDNLTVVPCTSVDIEINVEYYTSNNDISKCSDIENSINDYIEWQQSTIGRDINPDYIRKVMISAGASMVNVISPTYIKLENNQVAQVTSKTVSYKGSINE